MLIKKAFFNQYVQFTQNIEDRILSPHIETAETMKVRPIIGDALYTAMRRISDIDPGAWDSATSYPSGEYVIVENGELQQLYVSLRPTTGDDPKISPLDWKLSELGTFWIQHVRPWVVMESFAEFLVWHGTNVTQYGLRTMFEDSSMAIDADTRAVLLSNVNGKARFYRSAMQNRLADVQWTFDNTSYSVNRKDYKRDTAPFKIRAIGKKRNTSC
jgi:hypothetical protein